MNSNISKTINFFFILVIIKALTVNTQTAPAVNCPSGELICNDVNLGPTCYSPANFSCPSGSRGSILCGFQEHGPDSACGTICYDPVEYVCCGDQLAGANVGCATTTVAATAPATTTNPTSPPTNSSGCQPGQLSCDDVTLGPTCYDPSTASCPNGSLGSVLCGNQEHGKDLACGTICYDPVEYVCCGEQLAGADEGCATTTAPATSAPTTAAPSTAAPTTAAPTTTTNPTSPPTNSSGCPPGQLSCDDVTLGPTCYDPSTYSCPNGSRGSVLCGFQEHGPDGACGTICYDMTDYVCCDDQLFNADLGCVVQTNVFSTERTFDTVVDNSADGNSPDGVLGTPIGNNNAGASLSQIRAFGFIVVVTLLVAL